MLRNTSLPTTSRFLIVLFLVAGVSFSPPGRADAFAREADEPGELILDSVPKPRFRFGGVVGRRVTANAENWLTVAPRNNPGLLDMFARRDSGKKPDLVPWAGEFVGKYLISGVQAMRMCEDPQLARTLREVVDRLVELQAEDGYLGPWPKGERLRGHWDLWGHYHIMLGLMLWHEHTGDKRAGAAARRIADLVCDTYLGTDIRVFNAGSHEMNMGIIHGMAMLYRMTGRSRYLRMAKEVLKDFDRAGDYYRTALEGMEFFRTPRPRWESLHSLQGLVELYRVTGDGTYRRAFLHHWASMRRFDMRNTGGFSSGEAATGDPYRNDAIETCCVIAWQAVMVDALRLTGDSTIADDLELATFNAVFGSQHPSGTWCTYNTPMNGTRVPSHIDIHFQARNDTPHLNCCSVNGPRGYGMLSEWGVMRHDDRLVVNFYGPMRAEVTLADGSAVTITQETNYPIDGEIRLTVDAPEGKQFAIWLRIPAWSTDTEVSLNGQVLPDVAPGRYFRLTRQWHRGDQLMLRLNMSLRYEAGDLSQFRKASLYRGPILLAADSRFQSDSTLPVDVSRLGEAEVVAADDEITATAGAFPPWLVVNVPTTGDRPLRLIDFASAGATSIDGKPKSTYRSWLPAAGMRPPRPVAWRPADGSRLGLGPMRFVWRRPAAEADRRHMVIVSDTPTFERAVLSFGNERGASVLVPIEEVKELESNATYFWKIVARNEHGKHESLGPYKRFTIDPSAPPLATGWPHGQREEDMMLTAAPLRGDVKPEYGVLLEAKGWRPAPGPDGSPNRAIQLDGTGGMIKYTLTAFPEEDYTVSIWALLTRFHGDGYGQVFCAWRAGMNDPLRLVVTGMKLYARIEVGQVYGTEGVAVQTGRWYHIVGVKHGETLTLYLDGQARSSAKVPRAVRSHATNFAIGGNPNFTGAPEFLAARLADLRFFARALASDEVKQLYAVGQAAPYIEWDRSTLTLVARGGGYARMVRSRSRDVLCVFDRGGTIWVRRSTDDGKTWMDPVRVAGYDFGHATNPELLQMRNGWILCTYNERPTDGVHPFAIVTSLSKDGGRTWSPGQSVYAAGTRWENGCWEPAAIQLPSGEIQLFFANEGPYRTTAEQEITMLRSRNKAATWSNPTTISFRADHRDGMPVPLVLKDGGGIVVAIEDNGINGHFKPVIIHSSFRENWRKGFANGRSTRRWAALKDPLPAEVPAAAPYIRQMPTGETVLSVQTTDGGRRKARMVVYIGDRNARNFTSPSVPFDVGPDTACLWNSLFVKDAHTVTAVAGTVIDGVRGIWAIDGRLIRSKKRANKPRRRAGG